MNFFPRQLTLPSPRPTYNQHEDIHHYWKNDQDVYIRIFFCYFAIMYHPGGPAYGRSDSLCLDQVPTTLSIDLIKVRHIRTPQLNESRQDYQKKAQIVYGEGRVEVQKKEEENEDGDTENERVEDGIDHDRKWEGAAFAALDAWLF